MSLANIDRLEGSPEAAAEMLRNPEHPRENEGVFLDTQLVAVDKKFDETRVDTNGNILDRYRLTFSDGVKLNANHYQSTAPVSNRLILQTPAWMTGSRGHNQATQRKLAAAGYDSLLIGHVGEERDSIAKEVLRLVRSPDQVAKELKEISLRKQAHHMLEAAQHFTSLKEYNADKIDVFGESRGAMTGLWVLALANAAGFSVSKAMLVAPCFETGFGKEVVGELSGQVPLEFGNLVRTIGHVSFQRLIRYPSTVNPSPKSALYELAHGPTLFRGDAGAAVPYIQKDQDIMLLSFDNDLAGQRPRWREAFADHPNVVIQPAPGAHVSGIVDRRTVELTQDYLAGTARRLRSVA